MLLTRANSSECLSMDSSGNSYHSCCGNPELEEMAEAFQKELQRQELIQDHQLLSQVHMRHRRAKTFAGKDAVTVLLKVLQLKTPHVTREDAQQKGQAMMEQFQFFKHASSSGNERALLDTSTDFYMFENNLPCQVYRVKKQYKSYWEKVRLLEEHVEVKDRKNILRTIPNCFIASEAVDVMMELKLVRSRREAVHLMRKLNQRVNCCESAVPTPQQQKQQEFKDDNLFFQFVPANERMPEPRKRLPSPKRPLGRTKPMGDDSSGRTHRSQSSQRSNREMKDEEIKHINQRRANDIKQRLAEHKAEIRRKQEEAATAA